MANMVIRNLPEEVHRALRVRAAQHGRSTEAEVRKILETIVQPTQRIKLGSLLRSIAREAGELTATDMDHFEQARDKTPAEPLRFE